MNAIGGASGSPVTYAVTGPANVSGFTLTIAGAGTVTVTASQAGNANYTAAMPVILGIMVNKAVLTVTANNASSVSGQPLPSFSYTITGFVNADTASVVSGAATKTRTATATSAPGAYPITFSTENLSAANYGFSYVNSTLTIAGGAAQSITFNMLPSVTYGAAPFALVATAPSGLPVSYSVSGPASLSGGTLSINGVGSVIVTASQSGNTSYAAATPVVRSFTVSAASQIIAFTALPNVTFETSPIVLVATAMSGLPVVYSVTRPASLSGSTLSVTGVGTVGVTASQAENTNYLVASTVSKSFSVSPASQTITFSSIASQPVGATISLSAAATSGLPVTFATILSPKKSAPGTYTVTFVGSSGSLTANTTATFTVK